MTVSVTTNAVLRDEFGHNLRVMQARLEQHLGEATEEDHRQQYVGLAALFCFHFFLFRVTDKRMLKLLWDMQRKLPAVHLYGNIVLSPNEFLSRKLPHVIKALDKKCIDFDVARRDYLTRMDANIAGCVAGRDWEKVDARPVQEPQKSCPTVLEFCASLFCYPNLFFLSSCSASFSLSLLLPFFPSFSSLSLFLSLFVVYFLFTSLHVIISLLSPGRMGSDLPPRGVYACRLLSSMPLPLLNLSFLLSSLVLSPSCFVLLWLLYSDALSVYFVFYA